ncbi:MAG: dihydrolipoyl dehydrogenase [Acidimicrobiia bacterium]|nr:dihydrolipoyl dehydrogenase [Actinomycetota bacterium]MBL6926217.1 dihydrolipoyl dehydrogenase [Acidimicrobiia bacterium]
MTRHDLIVIGGGPAGYAAALYGASAGLDVGLVEEHLIGGTCLHVGCIPAKELLETASVLRAVKGASEFGVDAGGGEPSVDLAVSQERKRGVIDNLFKGLGSLLSGRGVTVYDGTGRLGPDHTVTVEHGVGGEQEGTSTIQADHVVLATGSSPRTISGFEVDGDLVVTSDELLSITDVPDRVVVIGGGAIGCEFASMLSDLGSEVTVLEALPEILVGCDADVAKAVRRSFRRRGISVHTGVSVAGHEPSGGSTVVGFGDDQVEVDLVVMAVGRSPRGDAAGLVGTRVEVDERGFISVDDRLLTGEPGVYAVGDVVATPQLAHVAFAEGMFVVKDLLGESPLPLDAATVPWCIYTHPEVAFAGLTEAAAIEAGHEVVVSSHRFVGNGRAMIVGDTDGLVKVVAEVGPDGRAGRILGVHMVGPWVTEQLGQGYLAVNWEATVDDVAAHIQPHPTLSELFGETVLSLTGRSLHG